jgi:hypothetical protein
MTNTMCPDPRNPNWAARGLVFAGLLARMRVSR